MRFLTKTSLQKKSLSVWNPKLLQDKFNNEININKILDFVVVLSYTILYSICKENNLKKLKYIRFNLIEHSPIGTNKDEKDGQNKKYISLYEKLFLNFRK